MAKTADAITPLPILELTAAPTPFVAWLKEIWAFRDVIGILSRKDFQVRYKRATFGLLWAVVIPMLQALVFIVIFSKIGKFNSAKFSYPASSPGPTSRPRSKPRRHR